MTDIQLIASDMDHTLLEEDGSVPTGLFDRIRALREHGVEFAAVSGRSIATLQGLFAPVRKAVTLVGDNGAVIERGSRRVYTNALPTATQQHLVVHAQRQRAGVPILSGVDAGYIDARDRRYIAQLGNFFNAVRVVPHLEQFQQDVTKFTAFYPDGDAYDRVEKEFDRPFGSDLSVTVGGVHFVDVMNPDVDKGAAIRQIGSAYGIPTAHMMAFGDGANDVPMLRTVKYSYHVLNALPPAAAAARFTTASNRRHGVLRIIDKVLADII
ncbi:HAD-IIB family hydrolase [Lacticaseibacillus thailandensis]|nr:HAD family hydrolase [Lacticaseibacillus thailandensis]